MLKFQQLFVGYICDEKEKVFQILKLRNEIMQLPSYIYIYIYTNLPVYLPNLPMYIYIYIYIFIYMTAVWYIPKKCQIAP